ncbi:MAG: MazG family protein [Pseudoclavibacter sp.]
MTVPASAEPSRPDGAAVHPHLDSLIAAVDDILGPDGCVWNRQQTHRTLARYLIEETFEAVDAIEADDTENLQEELGDVLYQVLLHSRIAAQEHRFDLEDVAAAADEKMRRRHPHVFGDAHADTVEEVAAIWDAAKSAEKSDRTSVLDGIPRSLPALLLADKVVGRAAKLGLIDGQAEGPLAFTSGGQVGQLLLAVVAAARAAGFDAEEELRRTVHALGDEIRDAEHDGGAAGALGADAAGEPAVDAAARSAEDAGAAEDAEAEDAAGAGDGARTAGVDVAPAPGRPARGGRPRRGTGAAH